MEASARLAAAPGDGHRQAWTFGDLCPASLLLLCTHSWRKVPPQAQRRLRNRPGLEMRHRGKAPGRAAVQCPIPGTPGTLSSSKCDPGDTMGVEHAPPRLAQAHPAVGPRKPLHRQMLIF